MALAALGEADYARLGRIAQLRARGLVEVDWRDLLQEAVQRSLDGTRRWPNAIPFLVFLREVIRSLASEYWRKRNVMRFDVGSQHENEMGNPLDFIASDAPDPERIALMRNLFERLQSLFAGDQAALAVLAGLYEEFSPTEIQARAGLSQTEYDSTRRRIRREVARADMGEFI